MSSTSLRLFGLSCALGLVTGAAACGSKGTPSPTTPTPTTSAPRLTAPTLDTPANQAQLDNLRPTLTVLNGTSDQTGTRTYEFHISDRSDFASLSASPSHTLSAGFLTTIKTGVAEDSSGKTSYTPESDLQPTTRFYWRARLTQGTTTSEWSATQSFNSKLVGYNRAGELYDPLIHGETIGTPIGSTTFVAGKGIRIENQNSYVRYQLAQTITNGEFSVELEGLRPNGPGGKLRVFSMMDGTGNLCNSKFLFNVQYRGTSGNPDNAFSFKALFGDEDHKLEPDLGRRIASVRSLDPARTYYWKATWGTGINLLVQEDRIGGNTIYDYGVQASGGSYNPTPHYAYLGANNGSICEEDGSWPGVIYRNLWIGNRARPASLGSALDGR
ncbi:MAG: hypothetical protein EXQ55_04805 [Acidobacteria bacterium]|nr:hypothetical protein [Acidobacteriota bacterium]